MESVSPTVLNLIIFVLAIYVGYHVVWTVTPALHTPLMAVTNAISAIVIVGAMLAAALTETELGKTMGVLAVALAAVNIFGGFLVTRRMLEVLLLNALDVLGEYRIWIALACGVAATAYAQSRLARKEKAQ
jgi:H+-translocating NAD(P) transhydrogenase subunit alpha